MESFAGASISFLHASPSQTSTTIIYFVSIIAIIGGLDSFVLNAPLPSQPTILSFISF